MGVRYDRYLGDLRTFDPRTFRSVTREPLLMNWVNLKQRRDESVADFAEYAHTKDTSRGEPTRPKDISDIGPISTVTIAPTPKPAGEATSFSPSTTRTMICYKCRREGHISKNCPMHNLVTDSATDPLKAVGFYYVEPIQIFDSMTVDFKAASPANALDTGAKHKLSPKAIIGLDGMKRLGTEIILDDKMMVQF
ncbi:hypothetical protein Pmar_PMAR023898 [Perkinsus marinus ATCC 50983]|uniref:CCHC-type domain-containing protein n=1 Tax=Perkinsus marinus (strain ATCC 50983 / TXsc) TaxID=423536 RepID=C5LRF5_PERM5|nr:hypothetical protein Pmar_PMAR023898 [Perkinsus marinus ATCC 50983]EER00687.1 hypothetical protein Pmar_PMAR023898 [Perkinsus marinus ATCC 50983]|eukprot:XP_002767969.1 hypothetical protein Pmar_PMAR023898 [Perkinsus marinus ATCC 50983]